MVRLSAAEGGPVIPRLAGNIVVQDFYDDPRLQRFVREIGPNLVQIKLFLHDLDEAHSNYRYLRAESQWQPFIKRITEAGGRVMLHLRNVPARLSLVPSVNREYQGKAPLTDAGEDEWREIVQEVVLHFNQDPDTLIDYVQLIGEPNIGTNWYDPRDPEFKRPENAVDFARFFELIANAVHDIDPQVLVGGPTIWFSNNDEAWWDGFLGYLAEHEVPLGFVSVHIYDVNFGIWDRGVALA